MKRPVAVGMILLGVSIFLLFFLNLLLGSVSVPAGQVWKILWGGEAENAIWQNIVLKSRFPQALTALVAGAGLSVAGLQMQTVFRNPLAGPSVLGVSSGSSLGVKPTSAFCSSGVFSVPHAGKHMRIARISAIHFHPVLRPFIFSSCSATCGSISFAAAWACGSFWIWR